MKLMDTWFFSFFSFWFIRLFLSDRIRADQRRTHRNYHVVSKEPLIIVTSEAAQDLELMSSDIEKERGKIKAHFLVLFWYSQEKHVRARIVDFFYRRHRKSFPEHQVTFLCNSQKEHELLSFYGVASVFCNQNCLLDERVYSVVAGVRKEYDVVYNARLCAFKRHELLASVGSLALIGGVVPGYSQEDARCRQFLTSALPDAAVLNYPSKPRLADCQEQNFPQIPADEISKYLALGRVGAVLSYEEGACYAGTEYLLAGLPVVSTGRRGGRDVFFDPEFSEIVEDDPKAVADAVGRLVAKNIPPEAVRARALDKMRRHREIFMSVLQRIYDQEGVHFDVRARWDELFTNKMIDYANLYPEKFKLDIRSPAPKIGSAR